MIQLEEMFNDACCGTKSSRTYLGRQVYVQGTA